MTGGYMRTGSTQSSLHVTARKPVSQRSLVALVREYSMQTPITGLRHPSFKLQALVYDILPTSSKHWFTTSFLQTPGTGLRHPSFKLQALVYDILPSDSKHWFTTSFFQTPSTGLRHPCFKPGSKHWFTTSFLQTPSTSLRHPSFKVQALVYDILPSNSKH